MTVKGNVVGGSMVHPDGRLTPVIANKGDPGAPGAPSTVAGPAGSNGWTPVLLPEQDGTRTLLKVTDWANGTGTKPVAGMYLGNGAYVTAKADAFNFNSAKRVRAYSAVTNASGVATITFGITPAFAAAPSVVALPANPAVLNGPTKSTVSSVTATGCVVTVQQQALLTGVLSLLVGATANVIVVEQ